MLKRPDEVVAARDARRVIGAVSALPPKQRQVIVRHAVDGESHERIATDLGMSAGSIRQLAHRARRTVREAAAALLPGPLLRVLPFGPDAAEVLPAAGGGAVLAKVAVVVVAAGAAGGGRWRRSTTPPSPRPRSPTRAAAPVRTPVATPPAKAAAPSPAGGGSSSGTSGRTRGGDGSGSSKHGSSGSGSGSSRLGLVGVRLSDSSGSGSGFVRVPVLPGSGSSGVRFLWVRRVVRVGSFLRVRLLRLDVRVLGLLRLGLRLLWLRLVRLLRVLGARQARRRAPAPAPTSPPAPPERNLLTREAEPEDGATEGRVSRRRAR